MSDLSLVPNGARARVRGWAVPVAVALGRLGLTPNGLTLLGFLGTSGAALAAANRQWLLAGVLVLAFGIFDLFDGALARATGRASKFGAFLDSTLDRTGENLVYAGVAIGAASVGFTTGVVAAVLALAFASVVTYARAKAEVVGLHGEVGLAPREVRLVLLATALVLTALAGGIEPSALLPCYVFAFIPGDCWGSIGEPALALPVGLIALLSAITVVQRIVHTKRQLDQIER